MTGDDGQSPAARAWVERRDEIDRAIAEAAARETQRHAHRTEELQQRVRGESPIMILVGFVVLFGLLLIGLWWFVDKVACDPVVSNMAGTGACPKR
jgi:hypothetical protein